MALNIKNQDVETLLHDVVKITGESKTEAVRKALEERRQRLSLRFVMPRDSTQLTTFLEDEIWPQVPVDLLGTKFDKAEEDAILGYGEMGV
ncbi:MAG: type II toxin-antitoxin system VapB family antitoxin [Chloroflexi bacterium]|nr:type II toxin-antitoxin system VapB family antitoxin [Chloroflexota bacterium]